MNEYQYLTISETEEEGKVKQNQVERELLEKINLTISNTFKNFEINLTVFEKAKFIEKLSNKVLKIVLTEKEDSFDNGCGYGREM